MPLSPEHELELIRLKAKARANAREKSAPQDTSIPTPDMIPEGRTGTTLDKPTFLNKAMASPGSTAKDAFESYGNKVNQLKNAVYTGVGKGAVGSVSNAGQLMSDVLEAGGLLPQGYTGRVRGGGQALEQALVPERDIGNFGGIQTAGEIATEVAPFMAVPGPAAGTKLPKMLGRYFSEGAAAGALQPAEGMGERITQALEGGAFNTLLPALMRGGGYLADKTNVAGVKSEAIKRLDPTDVKRSAKIAQRYGIYTDPAATPNPFNPEAAKYRGELGRRSAMRFPEDDLQDIADMVDKSDASANKLTKSFFQDVYEGKQPRSFRQEVDNIFDQFRKAEAQASPERVRAIKMNPAFKRLEKEFGSGKIEEFNAKLQSMDEGSPEWLDTYRRSLRDEVFDINNALSSTENVEHLGTSNKTMLRQARETAQRALDNVYDEMLKIDPSVADGINKSQQDIFVRNVAADFGLNTKTSDQVMEIPAAQLYRKVFAPEKGFNELMSDLDRLNNPEVRQLAKGKARVVRDIMNRYMATKSAMKSPSELPAPSFKQRSWLEQAAFYTGLDKLQKGQMRSLLHYIYDKQASPQMAEKVMAAKTPSEFMGELGRMIGITAISSMGDASEKGIQKAREARETEQP